MKRAPQTHLTTLTFPSGNTFTLQAPAHPHNPVTLTFAVGSKADTGLHWHETHTEYFHILCGIGKLTLECGTGVLETRYLSAASGIVTIPRYRRHCLGRGDEGVMSLGEEQRGRIQIKSLEGEKGEVDGGEWGKELVVEEWTDPRDGEKEVFFRNLAGVVSEPSSAFFARNEVLRWIWGWWVEFQLWVVFGELDNYPAIFGGRWRWLEWSIVHLVCTLVGGLGRLSGMTGRWDEYTPVELRKGAEAKPRDYSRGEKVE